MARKTSLVFLWNCDKAFIEVSHFVIPFDSAQVIQIKIILVIRQDRPKPILISLQIRYRLDH